MQNIDNQKNEKNMKTRKRKTEHGKNVQHLFDFEPFFMRENDFWRLSTDRKKEGQMQKRTEKENMNWT